jgi:hypothetical protein
MNYYSLVSHGSGKFAAKTRSPLVLAVVLAIHALSFVHIVVAFQLNPSTPPGEVIERQLEALKDGDIGTVYKFASPGNKRQTGDVTNFAKMVQSGPYRYVTFRAIAVVCYSCCNPGVN